MAPVVGGGDHPAVPHQPLGDVGVPAAVLVDAVHDDDRATGLPVGQPFAVGDGNAPYPAECPASLAHDAILAAASTLVQPVRRARLPRRAGSMSWRSRPRYAAGR